MTYAEATAYLDGFINLERGRLDHAARVFLTLDGVRELSRRFGDPHRKFASLHIAGTKGKGSVCAFASSILQAQGFRVGRFISPHLEDVRERISLNGENIPEQDFARIVSACKPALEDLRHNSETPRKPTYFEILTHLAFTWFAEQKVDVAVIETGLGGRLDVTNILSPIACGISNISHDHTAILGDTLEQIATEKAGIIKPGVPVVSAPQQPEVMRVLRERAASLGAPLEFVGDAIAIESVATKSNQEWPLPRAKAALPGGLEYEATLGLRGTHQLENWAVALRLADLFCRHRTGTALTQEAVQRGSLNVAWPGRLEKIGAPDGPAIYLDGAHNVLSLEIVLRELRANLRSREPLVCVFGCARDKDIEGMLRALAQFKFGADAVLFTDAGNPRSAPPEDLAALWKIGTSEDAEILDSGMALERAVKLAGRNGIVLVAGSLYLVGKIRASTRQTS